MVSASSSHGSGPWSRRLHMAGVRAGDGDGDGDAGPLASAVLT